MTMSGVPRAEKIPETPRTNRPFSQTAPPLSVMNASRAPSVGTQISACVLPGTATSSRRPLPVRRHEETISPHKVLTEALILTRYAGLELLQRFLTTQLPSSKPLTKGLIGTSESGLKVLQGFIGPLLPQAHLLTIRLL